MRERGGGWRRAHMLYWCGGFGFARVAAKMQQSFEN